MTRPGHQKDSPYLHLNSCSEKAVPRLIHSASPSSSETSKGKHKQIVRRRQVWLLLRAISDALIDWRGCFRLLVAWEELSLVGHDACPDWWALMKGAHESAPHPR